MGNKLVAMMY